MNSYIWKNVFDNLDEDIINSAAERFSKKKYSGENPADYPADSSPVEYRFTKKKSRKPVWIAAGIGTAAVAALGIGIYAYKGADNSDDLVRPYSGDFNSSSSTLSASSIPSTVSTPSTALTSLPLESDDSLIGQRTSPEGTILPTEPVTLNNGGYSQLFFENYFYGKWTDDGGWTMELGYTPNEFFSHSLGQVVAAMELDSSGCYMLRRTADRYDALFVPQDNKDTLYYYYNAPVTEEGEIPAGFWKEGLDNANIYTRSGVPEEGNSLGYFGIERLAQEMGVDSSFLLNQDIQTEGDTPLYWTRNVNFSDWDTVIALEDSPNEFILRMKYAWEYRPYETRFFDVTFRQENDSGWFVQQVKSTDALYFGTEDQLFEGVTRENLVLYKEYFATFWKSTDEKSPNVSLIYTNDIFTPAEYCADIRELEDGCALYHITKDGLRVYYVPKDNTEQMYLYIPDENGFAERDSCAVIYVENGGKDYFGSIWLSYMGLERYKLMHYAGPEGGTLKEAMEQALSQVLDDKWSASYYTSDMENWNAYRIIEESETSALFSYQQFTREGDSRWITQELVNDGSNWTLGEYSERLLTNEDSTDDPLEMSKIPIDWSEDYQVKSSESEVAGYGR